MKAHDSQHDAASPGDSAFRKARFDEADVAAFVEGELDASRLADMHGALERHPEVRAMVDAMRAQREVLRSFEDEHAPADLMTRVGEALHVEPEPMTIARQPGVVRVRPNPMRVFVESSAGRRFAAAAGLLLVAGVAIMLIARVVERTPIGDTSTEFTTPLALSNNADSNPADAVPDKDARAVSTETIAALAQADSASPQPLDEPVAAVVEPITPERAAALAREGRLAFRVLAEHEGPARAIAKIAEQSDGSGTWRIRADVPPAIVVALAPPTPSASTPEERNAAPILADDDGTVHEPFQIESPLVEFRYAPTPPDVYLLESAATPDALAGALDALADRAKASVEFVELDEPIETPDVIDADSVLWWNTPIEEWNARIAVPVIVERSGR